MFAVWFISQPEQTLISQLNQLATKILQIDDLKAGDLSAIMLLTMMYQPLRKAPFYSALKEKALHWPEQLSELMNMCLEQPQEVAAAAQVIPSLGLSSNATSRRVKTQYEEHPYPRWTSLGYNQKTDYYASLQALFPRRLNDLQPESGPINVLVAGCGTGRHALRLVKYFHRMQVTAMDLSASALGYAQVQADHHRLPVDFIIGDILVSERLGQQFDVIESSGVLHHMESPEAGLSALVDVLKPGGIMKLALYSRQARTLISELRSELNQNLPQSEPDIRTVREALLHQGEGRWRAILQSPDFYSMSSVRDLLFHTQEHTFDLQEIRRLIEGVGLEWVGIVP
ncbi:MAG TPA: class I SAM-dependent methyltransferase, partial [Cytophagales bacterium]|nr:class I SAM-dependent methyltransferase [Cytophagales bacterium]